MKRYALVVDDDPDAQAIVRMILNLAGWDARCVSDGAQALSEVSREIPELIILDLMMPVMNGMEVIQHLQKDAATQSIPVIVSSAMSNAQELRLLGVAGIVNKGSTLVQDLLSSIGRIQESLDL